MRTPRMSECKISITTTQRVYHEIKDFISLKKQTFLGLLFLALSKNCDILMHIKKEKPTGFVAY